MDCGFQCRSRTVKYMLCVGLIARCRLVRKVGGVLGWHVYHIMIAAWKWGSQSYVTCPRIVRVDRDFIFELSMNHPHSRGPEPDQNPEKWTVMFSGHWCSNHHLTSRNMVDRSSVRVSAGRHRAQAKAVLERSYPRPLVGKNKSSQLASYNLIMRRLMRFAHLVGSSGVE